MNVVNTKLISKFIVILFRIAEWFLIELKTILMFISKDKCAILGKSQDECEGRNSSEHRFGSEMVTGCREGFLWYRFRVQRIRWNQTESAWLSHWVKDSSSAIDG